MKKILFVFLVLFTTYMSYVIVGGFIQKQQKDNSTNSTATVTSASPTANTDVFTIDDVAKHNSSRDCWLIINNKVYNVGNFLGEHPGGAHVIIPYCGKEATKAFDTQDRGSGGGHSSQASNMLTDYLVGNLKAN